METTAKNPGTVNMQQVQKQRFKIALEEIFGRDVKPKILFEHKQYKDQITGAQLVVTQSLDTLKINQLLFIGRRWDLHVDIAKNGMGLKIEFSTKKKK